MHDKILKAALALSVIAAFALGGAAVGGAVSGGTTGTSVAAATDTTGAGTATASGSARSGWGPARSDETALTGDTATKVQAAALARVAGGTIERIETDADGHAAYEAHMTNADGQRVTVYVNEQYEVVSVETGP